MNERVAERDKQPPWLRRLAAPAAVMGGVGWYGYAPQAAAAPLNILNGMNPAVDAHQVLDLDRAAQLRQAPELHWGQDPNWNSGWTQAREGQSPLVNIGREARPWTVAHELGHVKAMEQHPDLAKLTHGYYYPPAGLFGALAASAAPTRNLGRIAAAMGTAASVPMLANEAMASHYGGKMLAQQSGHNLDYLKAYAGLPTYAAAASAPAIAYLIASKLGRWRDEEREKRGGDWCTRLIARL